MLIEEVELWDFNNIDFQCINALQQQGNIKFNFSFTRTRKTTVAHLQIKSLDGIIMDN